MNGSQLINRIRRSLKDVTSDTQKGEFWNDEVILLVLNQVQMLFINYCLNKNMYEPLNHLLVSSNQLEHTDVDTGPPFDLTNTTDFPNGDYLHYASAITGASIGPDLYMARIYLGGEAIAYANVDIMHACNIVGNNVSFIWEHDYSSGQLFYYTYPNIIVSGNFDESFDTHIYNDIFTEHAVSILTFKEAQNQRGFKKDKRKNISYILEPEVFQKYSISHESPYDLDSMRKRIIASGGV